MPKNKNLKILLILGSFFLSSCLSLREPVNFSDPLGPQYSGRNVSVEPAPGKTIKVVSYNLGLCESLPEIISLLKNDPSLKNADILCLQEANLADLKLLADALGCNYLYYPSSTHPENNKDFGSAILARWTITEPRKIFLPLSAPDRYYIKLPRYATAARITLGEKKIWVASLHLGVIISPLERQKQLKAVLAGIGGDDKNCIIAGDFNTYGRIHSEAVKEILNNAGFSFANSGAGWTYRYWYLFNHRAGLDYIFYRGLKLISSGKGSTREPSDHFPIWAEFAN